MTEFVASPERLIIGALLGFAVLLFLIIKLKIQPFIAIMSSALIIGLVSGMPFSMITDTLAEGVGNTLQTIAILIGLGSMFGAILQVSGGVEVIADTLLKVFGEKKAPWALGITGLIVGMPGPVLVAEMLGVELSYVIILGIVIGIPAMILAGPVFAGFIGKKIHCPVPSSYLENEKEAEQKNNGKNPNFWLIVCIILLPLFLIILNTLSSVIPFMKPAQPVLEFLGTPVIALLLSTICAMLFLGLPGGFSVKEITNIMTNSLHSCGNIILLIAGGGMLRFILQNSGIGELFGNFVGSLPLPMVLVAFLVAAVVRISVGSATVSMTMAAGIIASMPVVSGLSLIHI